MKNLLKYSLLLSFLLILKYPQAQETYSLPNFSFENWSTAPGDTLSVMGGMLTLPLYNAYQYPASWDYITYHINRSVSLGFQNIQVNTTLPLLKAAYETGSFVPHGNKALTLQTFKLSDIIPPSTYNMVSSYIDTFYTNMIFPSVLTTGAIDADHFLTLFTDMLDSVNTFNANQVIAAFSQSDMNDYFSGGLALNGFEPTRLHGYYKYTSAGTGNDNGGIMLIGTHYNTATGMREVVGGGFNRNFTDTDFYQPFDVVYSALPFADSVNTTPSADSLIILIISSANNNRQYGSLFYLDSLILYHDSIPRPDTCHAIQNLHLLTKDTFNITVAWTDSSAMCWQMEYGEHGYVLGSDTCYITTDTMLVLTRLTPSTEYDIYVRAVCNDTLFSDWSMTSVCTDALTDTCGGIINMQHTDVNTHSATITWQYYAMPLCWQMEYGEHGYVLGSDTCYITTDTMLVLTRLKPSTEYDIYVRAVCNDTLFSDWVYDHFTTTADSVLTKETTIDHTMLYPNPFHGKIEIQNATVPYSIAIYTTDGKCIATRTCYEPVSEINVTAKGILIIKLLTEHGEKVFKAINQ